MGDMVGNQTYTLLRAAGYLKDNRIPPRGFGEEAVPEEIAVIGVDDDPDYTAGSDRVTYHIVLPAGTQGVRVTAALNYQSLAYGFLRDLEWDAKDPAVARFLAMYDASEIRAETIASASAEAGVLDGESGTTPTDSVTTTTSARHGWRRR